MPNFGRIVALTLAAAALVLAPGAASSGPTAATIAPSTQDQSWMVVAHQGDLAEIAAGQAAVADGHSEAVKRLGQMMIDDHSKLDDDLTAVARRLGVALPTAPSEDQQTSLAALQAIDGVQFDDAWIGSQIDAHRAAIEAGKFEQSKGTDPTVTALAAAAAPIVQRHLDELQDPAPRHQSGKSGSPGGEHATGWFVVAILAVGIVVGVVVYVGARRRARRRPGASVAGPDLT